MATTITVRDVPDETHDELAARAALSGRSLQEYLRSQLIALARRPDPEVLLARVRDRKQRTGSGLSAESIVGFSGSGGDSGDPDLSVKTKEIVRDDMGA